MRRAAFPVGLALCWGAALSAGLEAQARSDTVARTVGAPRYRGVATLVPDLTISSANATEEYQFDRIRGLLAARDGSVWVIDGRYPVGTSYVRQFDSVGKFLRHVGRAGDGPGEYRGPTGIAQLRDGRIVLRDDMGATRVNVYTPDGKADTTWTFQTRYSGPCCAESSIRVDTAGTVWMWVASGNPFAGTGRSSILRLRPNGTVMTEVPVPALDQPAHPSGVTIGSGRGQSTIVGPYMPVAWTSWSPQGYFATVVSNRYAIDLRIPLANSPTGLWRDGDPVVSVRHSVPPVVVTEEEKRDQRTYFEGMIEARRGEHVGSLPPIVATKPPIRWLQFDDDARAWVLVAVPSERYEPPAWRYGPNQPSGPVLKWREPPVYDVLEANGAYVGRVAAPPDAVLMAMRGNTVWGVVRDNDGVEMVRRYRIVWR